MRACLATGAKMVIGTTGWYDKLPDMRGLAERKQAGLLYGTNFSMGVQVMLQLATKMAASLKDLGYTFSVEETHHESKLDSPSGTALTLAAAVEAGLGVDAKQRVPIEAKRVGDAKGLHVLIATSSGDQLLLTHESVLAARLCRRRGARGGVVVDADRLLRLPGHLHEDLADFELRVKR